MKLQLNEKIQSNFLVVIPAWQDFDFNELKAFIPAGIFKVIEAWIQKKEYNWKSDELQYINFNNAKEDKDIILLGLGEKKENFSYNQMQGIFADIYNLAKKNKAKEINVIAEHLIADFGNVEEFIQLAAQTFEECSYEFDTYFEKKQEYLLKKAVFISKKTTENIIELVQNSLLFGQAINLAKQLVNEPANEMTPRKIAEMAQKTGNSYDFEVKVYDEKNLIFWYGRIHKRCKGLR